MGSRPTPAVLPRPLVRVRREPKSRHLRCPRRWSARSIAPAHRQDFAAGDTVSHKTFGTGTVISVAGDMIEVQFEKTGQTKKLMKGFAPIVKLT